MGSNLVWCGICAKYLAFGTYPTSTVGALMTYIDGHVSCLFKNAIIILIIYIYIYIYPSIVFFFFFNHKLETFIT